jgi:hypothetical protein
MPNPDPQAAREAAERIIEIDAELEKGGHPLARYVDLHSEYELLAFELAEFVRGLDPTCLLRQPEWEEIDFRAEYGWQSAIGGYYVSLRHSGQWRAGIYAGAMSEIKMCDSLEAAKSACWEHYRAAMRMAFQIKSAT